MYAKYYNNKLKFSFFMHPLLVYWDLTLTIFAVHARYFVQWTPWSPLAKRNLIF